MKTLIFWGNELLNKAGLNISRSDRRSFAGTDIYDLDIPRGYGSRVVNSKKKGKVIDLSGTLFKRENDKDFLERIDDINKMFADNDEHYLRFVYDYDRLVDTTTTAGWSLSGSIDLNLSDYLLQDYSLDVTSTAGVGTILENTAIDLDLSDKFDAGYSINIWVMRDNLSQSLTSLRLGSDSSNYIQTTAGNYNEDYEGNSWYNQDRRWKCMSFRLDSDIFTTTSGSPVLSSINYLRIGINGLETTIGGILLVNENKARNYKSYRIGEVNIDGNYYNLDQAGFSVSFLNYTGYAEDIDYREQGSTTSTGTGTITFTMPYVYPPMWQIDVTASTATNVVGFDTDLVGFKTDTWYEDALAEVTSEGSAQMDYLLLETIGVIDDLSLYYNSINFTPIPETTSIIDGIEADTELEGTTYYQYAQQFTADFTGTVTFNVFARNTVKQLTAPLAFSALLYSDSSNLPSTLLSGGFDIYNPDYSPTIKKTSGKINYTVTSGTKYWIVLNSRYTTTALDGSSLTAYSNVGKSDSDIYSSHYSATRTTSTGSWTNSVNDLAIEIGIVKPITVNYEASIKTKRRWL